MNDEEIANYITAMQKGENPWTSYPHNDLVADFLLEAYTGKGYPGMPPYQQELDLDSLLGRSYAPSEEFREWSQGGSPIPEIAEAKMNSRELIETMLALMRTEETANLHKQDVLPPHMMEQRNIDPRDYGADLPPNAPQSMTADEAKERAGKSRYNRAKPLRMRWLDQLLDHMNRRVENWDSGTPTAPPQLTGRFGDKRAF